MKTVHLEATNRLAEAIDLIDAAMSIALRVQSASEPPDRIDSVAWRLADALLLIGEYAHQLFPGSETPGIDYPTGRDAQLATPVSTPTLTDDGP